ncbi:MAG: hypothetical protein HC906_05160 [Bacteroidales bacterium]|nr:hypothetical protein [Bacteroidales bacterium]
MMLLMVAQLTFPLIGILFLNYFFDNPIDKKKFTYISLFIIGIFLLIYLLPNKFFNFMNNEELQYFDEQIAQVSNNPNYMQQYEDFKSEVENVRILIFKKDALRSLFFYHSNNCVAFSLPLWQN